MLHVCSTFFFFRINYSTMKVQPPGGNFNLACMGFLLIAGIALKKRKVKKETVSEKA